MISPVRNPVKLPRRAEDVSVYFRRNSVAYLSDGTQVASGVARFETGKFGKAIMVEEGTTNLWSKGNPETWEGYSIARIPSDHYSAQIVEFQGRTCLKVHIVSAGDGTQDWRGCWISHRFTTVTGDTYTQQCEIYVEPGGRFQGTFNKPQLIGEETLSGVKIDYDLNQVGTWQKLIRNSTANADGKGNLNIFLFSAYAGTVYDVDYTVYLYHPQIEKLPYATSFIDGTRVAETLTIPTAGVLNPQEGTVELWAWLPEGPQSYLFTVKGNPDDNNNRLFVYGTETGSANQVMNALIGTGSGYAITPGISVARKSWHYFAVRWTATTLQLTVDGTTVSASRSGVGTFGDVAYVGSSLGQAQANTLIDDLRISSRARTDEEIREAYVSGIQRVSDEWVTATLL